MITQSILDIKQYRTLRDLCRWCCLSRQHQNINCKPRLFLLFNGLSTSYLISVLFILLSIFFRSWEMVCIQGLSHLWSIWVLLVSLSGFHVVGCLFIYSFSLSNRRPPDQYLLMQKKMKCIMSWLWQKMISAFFDFLAALICFSYYSFHLLQYVFTYPSPRLHYVHWVLLYIHVWNQFRLNIILCVA